MSVHNLFSICFEACTRAIVSRVRKPTVFTAPECVDSLSMWIREHKRDGSQQSRLEQVIDFMNNDPSTHNFMAAFRAFASENTTERTETFFWLLENEAKAPELWRCNLGWMILFSVLYSHMSDVPCIKKWHDQHTDGWSLPFKPLTTD